MLDRGQRGFSLPEALVVLGLTGLAVGTAMIGADRFVPRWRLRAAASDLALDLTAARTRAALSGAGVTVAFDTARQRYTVVASPPATGTTPAALARIGRPVATLPSEVRFARPDGPV